MGFFSASLFNIFVSTSVLSPFFVSMTLRLPQFDPGVPLPTEEAFTELHQKFERQLDATLEQKEILSIESITELLHTLPMLKDDTIEIIDIQPRLPRRPQKMFQLIPSPERILRSTLVLARQQHTFQTGSDLTIVRSNNERIGLKLPERMYYDSPSGALFLQYEKSFERRTAFSQRMFLTAIRADYAVEVRTLSTKNISKKIKKKQRALLDAQFPESMSHPKSLTAIPYGVLHRQGTEILNDFSRYRAEKRVTEIIAYAHIPYGVFSWFYEHHLGKEGYEGPTIMELFLLALHGRSMRNTENPAYALIGPYIRDVPIIDTVKLTLFSEALLKECDILSPPDEHALNGSTEQRVRYWKHRAFFLFFREYLGRVFNGLYGNTPNGVTARIRQELEILHLPNKERRLDILFHDPFPEERILFSRMKWHGTSVINSK